MMGTKHSHSHKVSRRNILKKLKSGAKFVVPTLVTFEISNLHVAASNSDKLVPPGTPADW